jgi:hypothetical protein
LKPYTLIAKIFYLNIAIGSRSAAAAQPALMVEIFCFVQGYKFSMERYKMLAASIGVYTENLNSHIVAMEPAKNRA